MPRSMTVLVAATLLILLTPVMLAVTVALVAEGKRRPIFYVSSRVGRNGKQFRMVKFCSMLPADGTEGAAGGHAARRITPVGRVLRRYRLDELPQLLNVLRGDLDLVGMRPPIPAYVEAYPQHYQPLLSQRPGITGLASVLFHDREDQLLSEVLCPQEAARIHAEVCIPVKTRLDRIYQRHRSTQLDLYLLWMTAARVWGRWSRPGQGRGRGQSLVRRLFQGGLGLARGRA